jgi:hypothetical protein
MKTLFPKGGPESDVLLLPDDVLEEMKALQAAIGNAGNPTGAKPHDTILVRPDEEMTYVLRPGVKIYGSMLKSTRPLNFNPPIIHFDRPRDTLPEKIQAYLREHARVHFTYTVDDQSCRRTVPESRAERAVLVVGDSVAFGVGVDDAFTTASRLQNLLGEDYRVVNGGVGGYSGRQCLRRAERLAERGPYHVLVYIACQNDFMEADDWDAEAEEVLKSLKDLAGKFNDRVVLLFHTVIQVSLHDLFLEGGWRDRMVDRSAALGEKVEELCVRYDFAHLDWNEIVAETEREEQSIFAGLGLYVDQCHLSPRGSLVLARKLVSCMEDRGWIRGK